MPKDSGLSSDGVVDQKVCAEHAQRYAQKRSQTIEASSRLKRIAHSKARSWKNKLRRLFEFRHVDTRRLARTHLPIVGATPGEVPDCPRCQEHCCRGPHVVTLEIEDALVLHEAHLGWSIGQAQQLDETTPVSGDPDHRHVKPLPTLKHNEGQCVFFDEQSRCSIYPIRPRVCRAYPYQIAESRDHIRYAKACPQRHPDSSPAEADELIDTAIAHYNAKIDDWLLLTFTPKAIAHLGLKRYFPNHIATEISATKFQTVLDRVSGSPHDE